MSEIELTADQRDALQEVANIGMGQAGAALASLLETFVNLSVPRIRVVQVTDIREALRATVDHQGAITAVRQSFQCAIRGEAIVVYSRGDGATLWDLMGYEQADGKLGAAAERELLFEVANLLMGACICSVFEQLGHDLSFSRPSIIIDGVPLDYMLPSGSLPWTVALLLEVKFSLEHRQFTAHLLMLMPEESIDQMKHSLDNFLALL
jgi:chemotaxis protein CheC